MSKYAVFVEGKFEQNGQEQEEKGNHVSGLPGDGGYQLRTFAQAGRGETAAQEIQSPAPPGDAAYRKAQVIRLGITPGLCDSISVDRKAMNQGEHGLALFAF